MYGGWSGGGLIDCGLVVQALCAMLFVESAVVCKWQCSGFWREIQVLSSSGDRIT